MRFYVCVVGKQPAAIIRRGWYADSIATPEAFENQRAHIKANQDTDTPLTRYKVKQ